MSETGGKLSSNELPGNNTWGLGPSLPVSETAIYIKLITTIYLEILQAIYNL